MCSKKASMADEVGEMDTMPSVWHFLRMERMYLDMCSVIVRMLPWPTGAFGPRNTLMKRVSP